MMELLIWCGLESRIEKMVRKVAEKPLKRIFDRELSLITERYNINNQIRYSEKELGIFRFLK